MEATARDSFLLAAAWDGDERKRRLGDATAFLDDKPAAVALEREATQQCCCCCAVAEVVIDQINKKKYGWEKKNSRGFAMVWRL